MHLSLKTVLVFLERYKYGWLFPAAIIEGPIVTVIAGFLISLGYLNLWISLVVIVLGDLAGDALHYAFGRYGFHIPRIRRWIVSLGYTEVREEALKKQFREHPGKTYAAGKIAHGVGGFVLVAAGIARTDFRKFLWYNVLATVPKSAVLLLIGYFLGSSYGAINTYLGYVAIGTFALAIALGLLWYLARKKADALINQ